MEAFSLLKYWRSGAGAGAGVSVADTTPRTRPATKNAVAASAAVSPCSSDDEEGPYFDLEFTLPDHESEQCAEHEEETASGSEDEDDEDEELKFAVAGDVCTDQNAGSSPSDDLFFKGDLIPIEHSSILLNGSEENSKFPVFLLKSATKFRVLLLKLKKSKSGDNGVALTNAETPESGVKDKDNNHGTLVGKLLAVKFKVEEVPLVSLFTRDASSKGTKQNAADESESNASAAVAADEKKLTKEVVQKYLKMVKPFYVRVSKRYTEKLKFSGHLNLAFPSVGARSCTAGTAPPSPAAEKGGKHIPPESGTSKTNINLQAGLKVVRNHLGKSRSASSTVATTVTGSTAAAATITANRRDDSLLQLQDGIQGAILHCKKSFNASRDGESSSCSSSSMLIRCVSDPSSHEKLVLIPRISSASTESESSYSREAKEDKAASSC